MQSNDILEGVRTFGSTVTCVTPALSFQTTARCFLKRDPTTHCPSHWH